MCLFTPLGAMVSTRFSFKLCTRFVFNCNSLFFHSPARLSLILYVWHQISVRRLLVLTESFVAITSYAYSSQLVYDTMIDSSIKACELDLCAKKGQQVVTVLPHIFL